jgi:serine/threonine protein kinase
VRLALTANSPDEAAVLKTVFYVLQTLQHPNLVTLFGCNSGGGGGGFAIIFDLLRSSSSSSGGNVVVTLHDLLHKKEDDSESTSDSAAQQQRRMSTGSGSLLILRSAPSESATDEPDAAPSHTTETGRLDLALQMTLALEYIHANQIVHGRLSSRTSFSFLRTS